MKYTLRLNGDPNLSVEVSHVEKVNDTEVIIDDDGTFENFKEGIVCTKFELYGEDGELYAMRRLPSHLPINLTSDMKLTIRFRLSIGVGYLSK